MLGGNFEMYYRQRERKCIVFSPEASDNTLTKWRNLMKKYAALTMIVLLAGSLTFAQATGEANSAKEETVLHLWMGIPAENGPQDVIDAFNREFKEKGIRIEYERYVNNDQGNLKLETNLLSGSEIDVYASYGGLTRVAKRAEAKMALDLTSYLKRDNMTPESIFGETAIALSRVNGLLYSLPTTLTKTSFLINKTMFDEAGIPVPDLGPMMNSAQLQRSSPREKDWTRFTACSGTPPRTSTKCRHASRPARAGATGCMILMERKPSSITRYSSRHSN
jgi:maltose-binding protein MalE